MSLKEESKMSSKNQLDIEFQQQILKMKKNQKRIESFKQLECLIKEFKVQVEEIVDKILTNICSRVRTIEKDLKEYDTKSKIDTFEDEVEILSKSDKGSYNYKIPLKLDKLEVDNLFYDSIKQIFSSFTSNPSYNQVIEHLQQNKNSQKLQELKIFSIQNQKELDKSKTPCLNIKCNKHGKEIIMLNLEQIEVESSRLICVDCINNNEPIKYTSLQDAYLKWKDKSQDKIKTCQNSRLLQQEMIISNLKGLREQQNKILSELIDKLNNEQQSIQLVQQNQLDQTDIYEFNQEQIEEITLILCKTDKLKVLSDLQANIEQEDQIRYNLITNNLTNLFEYGLLKREEILKILGQDNSNVNTIQIEDSKMNKEILRIIQKFNVYYNIFNQSLNLYKSIIQNIQELSIQCQSKNEQSEETNHSFDQFIQKFTKDTIQLQRFLSIDQQQDEQKAKQIDPDSNCLKITLFQDNYSKLQQQFNSLAQTYNDSIKQNEILINDKELIKQNYQKLKEDCINFTSQINNLDQQLKDKNNNITKINELLQQKEWQFIQLQRDCKDVKYLQLQIQIVCYYLFNSQQQLLQQQQQNSILNQYPFQLTFSQQFKHNQCQISSNGKLAILNGQCGLYCCICDQIIPKHGLVKFAFRILNNSYVMIGICFRDMIQKNGYYDNYGKGQILFNNINIRAYFIQYDGKCFNHDLQDKNVISFTDISFTFTFNDVVIVEVDIQNKYIKWIKQSTNESYVNINLYVKKLNIDTSQDLYPCVNLHYYSKVEICSEFNE